MNDRERYAVPHLEISELTRLEAAQLLGIHPQSLIRLQTQGHIHGRLVHGTWLFDRAYLEQWASRYDARGGPKRWPEAVQA